MGKHVSASSGEELFHQLGLMCWCVVNQKIPVVTLPELRPFTTNGFAQTTYSRSERFVQSVWRQYFRTHSDTNATFFAFREVKGHPTRPLSLCRNMSFFIKDRCHSQGQRAMNMNRSLYERRVDGCPLHLQPYGSVVVRLYGETYPTRLQLNHQIFARLRIFQSHDWPVNSEW
ncbi:hypothetical protein TNCV_2419771 [Trichonephila clavipes]|nr:hypothetical protein TNCV_2419771 [Trichonephila clavipes]